MQLIGAQDGAGDGARRARWTFAFCLLLSILPVQAAAEDVFVASLKLRGGIDANPTLQPGASRAAGFAGVDAAFAAGRGDDDARIGVVGDMQHTDYAVRGLAPAEHYKLALKAETALPDDWSLRSTTGAEVSRNYSLRSFDAVQTVRIRADGRIIRPFLTGELRYTTLNETSIVFGDFLPESQRFARATAIPGVLLDFGKAKIGTSLNVSATRYLDEPDVFGFRRNNERVQPYLFFMFNDQGLDVFASISRLNGFWHDPDFSDVRQTLYEVSVGKKAGPFSLDISAQRSAEDTTFPISPLALVTSAGVTLGYQLDAQTALRGFARRQRTDYLDSPFYSDNMSLGIGVDRDLGNDMTLGLEIARITGTALGGEAVKGGVAMLSLSKKFAGGEGPKQWAANTPPTAVTVNPNLNTRSSQTAYQP